MCCAFFEDNYQNDDIIKYLMEIIEASKCLIHSSNVVLADV